MAGSVDKQDARMLLGKGVVPHRGRRTKPRLLRSALGGAIEPHWGKMLHLGKRVKRLWRWSRLHKPGEGRTLGVLVNESLDTVSNRERWRNRLSLHQSWLVRAANKARAINEKQDR